MKNYKITYTNFNKIVHCVDFKGTMAEATAFAYDYLETHGVPANKVIVGEVK
jgi:hypothetical protein